MTEAEREEVIATFAHLHRLRKVDDLIEEAKCVGWEDLARMPTVILRVADAYLSTLRRAEAESLLRRFAHVLSGLDGTERCSAELIRGHLDLGRGDLKAATEQYTMIAEGAQEEASDRQVAIAENGLGVIEAIRGNCDSALRLFARSAATWQRIGDFRLLGASNHNAGIIARDWGAVDVSSAHFRTAAEFFGRDGHLEEGMFSLGERALLYVRVGDMEVGAELIRRSAALSRKSRSSTAGPVGLCYEGMLLLLLDHIPEGLVKLRTALSTLDLKSQVPLRLTIQEELCVALAALGRKEELRDVAADTRSLLASIDAPRRVDRLGERISVSVQTQKAAPRWMRDAD